MILTLSEPRYSLWANPVPPSERTPWNSWARPPGKKCLFCSKSNIFEKTGVLGPGTLSPTCSAKNGARDPPYMMRLTFWNHELWPFENWKNLRKNWNRNLGSQHDLRKIFVYDLWGPEGETHKKIARWRAMNSPKLTFYYGAWFFIYFFRPRDPSKKLRQVLGISFLQFLALESLFKG